MAKKTAVREDQTTNGAEEGITATKPYTAFITLKGDAPLLFHNWNCESIAEKAGAAKGSKSKKTDDIESYVYRDADGYLGIPGKNFHGALIEAGRYQSDPRSPRKSMKDMLKAAIVPLDVVAPFHPKKQDWDYLDKQRVTIQRAGITRTRPAMLEGWQVTFRVLVTLPDYLTETVLRNLAREAGRLIGLCDFRPTYGRFGVTRFEILEK